MSLRQRLLEYAELVKFEHTLFALPFALSAMLLASPHWPPFTTWVWIILAMVGGRTYAMGLNRLMDASFDAQNPRTANRGIPAGRVSLREARMLTLCALLLLITATLALPLLCLELLPLAILLLSIYSLMKRFSSAAHLILGLCLGSSAIGGWLAVTGVWSMQAVLFGLVVTFWVTGFDIIYACQDVEVDRRLGLYSVPAWLGVPTALRLSKVCHGLAVLCFATFGYWHQPLAWPFWLAVLTMAAFLAYEHRLVRSFDLSRVDQAFFATNGWISVSVFLWMLLNQGLILVKPL